MSKCRRYFRHLLQPFLSTRFEQPLSLVTLQRFHLCRRR
ncbi:Uncharacterised protein [Vibrio cholerae]|nr:Uncharacterised protein [Vibrio cholerae]CSI46567.1 Uncharacterised protein [Vibrio cholerae]